MAQLQYPTAKYWVTKIPEDIESLSIDLDIKETKTIEKCSFKKVVKQAVQKKAFLYLQERKERRNSDIAKEN